MKVTCTFIGAQAQIDTDKTGGRNPLVELAQSLDILGGRARPSGSWTRCGGRKVADRAEDDPRLQLKPVAADPERGVEASNPEGSFEAMIRLMGGGAGGGHAGDRAGERGASFYGDS